jgi:hypothetical protein
MTLDLVQAFLKKWWVESDFKAPNIPLSLRLKGSGCHYNSIYNNTGTNDWNENKHQINAFILYPVQITRLINYHTRSVTIQLLN